MASRYTHSKVLRTIGQELEKRGIDLFELSCRRAHYTIEYSDPKPPHTQLLDTLCPRKRSDRWISTPRASVVARLSW